MNELSFLKRVYHADEKTESHREYKPATPFLISSPVKETSPEVWKEYILLITAITAAVLCVGILFIFR